MRIPRTCTICGDSLASRREKELRICFKCRRYGLVIGPWSKKNTPSIFELAAYLSSDENAESISE